MIANQETCSSGLSLQEFISFGSLRADGERTQWHNLKRELAASNLNLNSEAVCILIIQATWQAGLGGDSILRESHSDLSNPTFCSEILIAVQGVLQSIKANWMSDNTLHTLIVVVLRILSLNVDSIIASKALKLILSLRSVALQWTNFLEIDLHEAEDPEQINKIQQRLLRAAILCKMTFDVDIKHIPRIMDTADDLRVWVICCMRVQRNCPQNDALLPNGLRLLLMRDLKVSHSLHRIVGQLIMGDQSVGLNLAVTEVWSSFRPRSRSWNALEFPNDRWLTMQTAESFGCAQLVLYNNLDGELLVDGSPIGRLPTSYICNDLYLRIFGSQVLHTLSADMPGMLYMSARDIGGYVVYFGMREGDLVIRTRKGSRILEIIPNHRFAGDLPRALVDDYVHWLDLSAREIEFRPLDRRWEYKPENWRLRYPSGSTPRLSQGDRMFVDVRSPTYAATMNVFKALEVLEYVHVTLIKGHRLEIALPRYDLHFFLNQDGHIESYEFCKIIDPDQSLGTFIGLSNRLVLSGIGKVARRQDRILIVPEGEVSIIQKGSHIQATISVTGSSVRIFHYQIDETLRRIQGDADTLGSIYKAYLHAITSYMLPDPFLERTGTEEALSTLKQQSLSFTEPCGIKAEKLLTKIAKLTPHRNYYPEHLKVMQQVSWHPQLSALTQHDEFLPKADQVISSGDCYLTFHPDSKATSKLYEGREAHLLARAQVRNSGHSNSEFGGTTTTCIHDMVYQTRDKLTQSESARKSFSIALLVKEWPEKCEVTNRVFHDLEEYGAVSGFGTKYDSTKSFSELLDLRFDCSWGPLHELCRASCRQNDLYRLLFLFATIAYGPRIKSLTTLRTLLAFAFIPDLQASPVPSEYPYFELSVGWEFDENAIKKALKDNMNAYIGTGRKKNRVKWRAECDKHSEACNAELKYVFELYKRQWPCALPQTPSHSIASNIQWTEAGPAISALFFVWTANGAYRQYLHQVQVVLDRHFRRSPEQDYPTETRILSEDVSRVARLNEPLPSLLALLSVVAPVLPSVPTIRIYERSRQIAEKNGRLRSLVAALQLEGRGSDRQVVRRQYRDELLASYDAFSEHKEYVTPDRSPCSILETVHHYLQANDHVHEVLQRIRNVLYPGDSIAKLLQIADLWPRLTIRSLLALLSTKAALTLNKPRRDCLLFLGESMTNLQRARRLVLASEKDEVADFCNEIENQGHQNWHTGDWPDWLLMEIEGDFLIRPTQLKVALEMIKPSSWSNSLIQLNMGT